MIIVNPASGVPVYRQIVDQVKILTGAGALKPGDKLPSIRELAARLGVNPLTVQKAYDLLATDGLLEKSPGRGVFVSDTPAPKLARAEREELLRPTLLNAAVEARRLGITPARQIRLFTDTVEEIQNSHDS